MSFIIGSLHCLKKRILTSATAAVEIPISSGFESAQTLDFLSGEKTERLTLQQVFSPDKDKIDTLFRLICRIGDRSAVVFCNHRESVERVSALLKEKGIVNVFYHGALEQPERDSALAKFRNGSSHVLVTTDLASRGLDVPNIRYIIHYHLPANGGSIYPSQRQNSPDGCQWNGDPHPVAGGKPAGIYPGAARTH